MSPNSINCNNLKSLTYRTNVTKPFVDNLMYMMLLSLQRKTTMPYMPRLRV